jgi:NAD-dependent SIR2 family protein deacetylase
MRSKCPKCGVVFETPWHPTLVHMGSLKYLKCPSCGKSSMMKTNVKDPVTWFPDGAPSEENHAISETDQLDKRIEESRYERPEQ